MPHINQRIDFVADALIVHENKVLLRKHDKYKIWLWVGGHVELDEDPNQAVIREAKEEVGLDITLVGNMATFVKPEDGKELILPRFMNRHRVNEAHEHISFTYFATTKNAEITQGEKEISDEIRWFTREELEDPRFGLSERIILYAKKALEELSN
jgi:ADP-ribose pyrophosphatase YjhB (NUDIX family)